jgi:hypothetical protein
MYGSRSTNLSEGMNLGNEYTVELEVAPQGAVTGIRVTRGYARYGRPARWRRWLSRWFPWLLVHFHRSKKPTVPYPF